MPLQELCGIPSVPTVETIAKCWARINLFTSSEMIFILTSYPVDYAGHYEIVLGKPSGSVSRKGYLDLIIYNGHRGMMTLFFGDDCDDIEEIFRLREIAKLKILLHLLILEKLPATGPLH